MADIWHFRHDATVGGQLVQISAGVLMCAMFGYFALKILLIIYESGKGRSQRLEMEREQDREIPSPLGWYQMAFCIHISVTLAFILEGLRFGGGWPSVLLFGLGVGCWFHPFPEPEMDEIGF